MSNPVCVLLHANALDEGRNTPLLLSCLVTQPVEEKKKLWIQTKCTPFYKLTLHRILLVAEGLGKYIFTEQ